MDLSAGIVSQWDETKLKTVLAWIFAQKAMSPGSMWPYGRPGGHCRSRDRRGKPWRPDKR